LTQTLVVVDSEGRIKLPRELVERLDSKYLIVEIRGEEVVLKPVKTRRLSELFDTVEVDVDPNTFSDYSKLKKVLLEGRS